jgi:hypothetical protein
MVSPPRGRRVPLAVSLFNLRQLVFQPSVFLYCAVRAASAVAVLVGASRFAYGPSWILTASLLLAPLVVLIVLIFSTAIFGGTRLSDRAFRLIYLLLAAMKGKLDLFPQGFSELSRHPIAHRS